MSIADLFRNPSINTLLSLGPADALALVVVALLLAALAVRVLMYGGIAAYFDFSENGNRYARLAGIGLALVIAVLGLMFVIDRFGPY